MAYKKKTGGRKIGSRNKVPTEIKAMIRKALDELGGHKYLVTQGGENPASFLTLIGKLIPAEINHGGQPENPVQQSVTHGIDDETVALFSRYIDKQNRLKGIPDEQR